MGGLSTDSEHLRTLVSRLSAASVAVWIDGGWGVDALLGRQHDRTKTSIWLSKSQPSRGY